MDSRPFPRKRTRFSLPCRSDTSPVGDSWLYRAPREISGISTQPVKLFLSYFVREASFVIARSVDGGEQSVTPSCPVQGSPSSKPISRAEIRGPAPVAPRTAVLQLRASVSWALPFLTCVAVGIRHIAWPGIEAPTSHVSLALPYRGGLLVLPPTPSFQDQAVLRGSDLVF